jgi:1,4-alpha-glucan branching enzyme
MVPDGAKRVMVVGDFTDWQQHGIPMQKNSGGIWTASVALTPGTHRYRYIVDGEWWDEPACESRAPNPFGSQDMIRKAA